MAIDDPKAPAENRPIGKALGHAPPPFPDTLAALKVNPETGLNGAEVVARRKEQGFNEVAEKKGRPILLFLGKFWCMSAWMLEGIMVLSVALGKYSDFLLVSSL